MTFRPSLASVQTATVLTSCLVLVAVVFIMVNRIKSESRTASTASDAAWLASRIELQSGEILQSLAVQRQEYLVSEHVRNLDPELQAILARELSRNDDAAASAAVAGIRIGLSIPAAVTSKGLMDSITTAAGRLGNLTNPDEASVTRASVLGAEKALDAFFADPTVQGFVNVRLRLFDLRDQMRETAPALIKEASRHRGPIERSSDTVQRVTVVAAILAAVAAAVGAFIMSRRQQSLMATTGTLTRRNEQFRALYNVFSEINDTLSIRYVVRTTLQEALGLLAADVVVLRLLSGDDLHVAGSLTAEGAEVEGLSTVQLGEGLMGRAAKRGKTFRIDSNAESQMSEGQRLEGVQAGIAVPLIVGARVVGTLACWSKHRNAFAADDEQILEMMASQVATALAAADVTETNERRAYHDALTGLPNRRQLAEDIPGQLADMAGNRRPAAFAMVDIDHFKRFNDEFGHRVGDITLQRVASVLRASIREGDSIYRYGGEEFLIVFADVSGATALRLAERVRAAVQATPLTGESLEPLGALTISIGVSVMPDETSDVGEAIGLADKAMYQSKEAGRNQVSTLAMLVDLEAKAA
ncbi:MAG TPA: sensor domain-containing diguanylate cyclase [Dehalococcoidia bacterium]|nr:sensor domain-containing diguanylate cyclase [Dehalococcoidia bacterium]